MYPMQGTDYHLPSYITYNLRLGDLRQVSNYKAHDTELKLVLLAATIQYRRRDITIYLKKFSVNFDNLIKRRKCFALIAVEEGILKC